MLVLQYIPKSLIRPSCAASFYGKGIMLQGFDTIRGRSGAGALVIQIQELHGEPDGDDIISRMTIQNNMLHDSYKNDILKIDIRYKSKK